MKTDLNRPSHYRINLRLAPEQQSIEAQVELTFRVPTDGADPLIFYLHKQLELVSVAGEGLSEYEFDRLTPSPVHFMPEGGQLSLRFERPLPPGEQLGLEFAYRGQITQWPSWSANVLSADWTELGLYLPWFPYNGEYGDLSFSLRVQCTPGYQVRSYGDHVRDGSVWRFDWQQPTNDIVVVASRDLKTHTVKEGPYSINVHYVTLEAATVALVEEDLLWILSCFDDWFGGAKAKAVSLIQSPREQGGGYARRGLIVLGGLQDSSYRENRQAYARYLGHEAAHIWWWGAPTTTWQDWLNESLAEYSALLIVRQRFGQEAFERRLASKREAAQGRPPIWGFARDDRSTDAKRQEIEAILYAKGPVFLHELASKMGQESFLALCRRMVDQGVTSTDQFLDLLGELAGPQTRHWAEQTLKTK